MNEIVFARLVTIVKFIINWLARHHRELRVVSERFVDQDPGVGLIVHLNDLELVSHPLANSQLR